MKNIKKTLDIKKIKKEVKGITLIALAVTIIVLLILAGMAINLTIGNQVKVEGVTIPKGFYYVGGTKSDGIVISDAKADENKYSKEKHPDQANIPADGLAGNQFVWVPVEKVDEFKRYDGYAMGKKQSEVMKEVRMENYWDELSEPAPEGFRYTNEVEEYNAMKASVEKNKGFYVARFEAGNEGGKVVSKKGATVWNNIPWGTSMTEIGREGAVAKAKGMYTDKNTHAVTSTLMYGTQWDAIMTWIDPAYKTSTCDTSSSYVANSTGKGNYTGDIATCGSSDSYRVKNIYDLGGSVHEWTMEGYVAPSAVKRVVRGGCYLSSNYNFPSGFNFPASNRNFGLPVSWNPFIRFPYSVIFVMLNAKSAVYVEVAQNSEKALSLNIEKKELKRFRS